MHCIEHGTEKAAREWAQVHTESGEDPWADFIPLCRRCHFRYDGLRLGGDTSMFKRTVLLALAAAVLSLGALLLPAPRAHAATVSKRTEAMAWARAHEGAPYVWGATGPWGFDCSGLVYASYRHVGITLPRDTFEMLAAVGSKLIPEPISAARRGDLLFFGSGHVELATSHWHLSFGAQQPGTSVGYHFWSGWWAPTMAFRVRGAG